MIDPPSPLSGGCFQEQQDGEEGNDGEKEDCAEG
jgi:hypothetical protein